MSKGRKERRREGGGGENGKYGKKEEEKKTNDFSYQKLAKNFTLLAFLNPFDTFTFCDIFILTDNRKWRGGKGKKKKLDFKFFFFLTHFWLSVIKKFLISFCGNKSRKPDFVVRTRRPPL